MKKYLCEKIKFLNHKYVIISIHSNRLVAVSYIGNFYRKQKHNTKKESSLYKSTSRTATVQETKAVTTTTSILLSCEFVRSISTFTFRLARIELQTVTSFQLNVIHSTASIVDHVRSTTSSKLIGAVKCFGNAEGPVWAKHVKISWYFESLRNNSSRVQLRQKYSHLRGMKNRM